jgi:hypothetical protein
MASIEALRSTSGVDIKGQCFRVSFGMMGYAVVTFRSSPSKIRSLREGKYDLVWFGTRRILNQISHTPRVFANSNHVDFV